MLSSFAPRCTGQKHPGAWVFCHCATHFSPRSVRGGCETLSFSTNSCFLLFMFPRTASERFRLKVSRSFFTTFSLGKKPCGTQPSSWIQSHVRVLSIGTSYRTDASLQAMWLPASKNSKPWWMWQYHFGQCCQHVFPRPRSLDDQVQSSVWSAAQETQASSHFTFDVSRVL